MQSSAKEYNEKIEAVNRERKFHQVRFLFYFYFYTVAYSSHTLLCNQQSTGEQLNALATEWRELCEKNIEIEAVCAEIQNRIEQLRLEAVEW